MRKLVKQAAAAGCRVEETRGGHVKLFVPNGGIVLVSSSPSDHHAVKNARGDLRREGLKL